MKTFIENEIIGNFGKKVTQPEINEMKELIVESKITDIFNCKDDIFKKPDRVIHIDTSYLNNKKLYKIDVQRTGSDKKTGKSGDKETIGQAFISEAVKLEVDNTGADVHSLYMNVVNALERSMNEIKTTQTDDQAGTSHKYVVRTNAGL